MKHWEKIIEQKVSAKHEEQVLAQMDSLLDQNAALAKHKRAAGRGWGFWLLPATAAAALAFAVVIGVPLLKRGKSPATTVAEATPMLELAMEYELLADLREIQHLDELQKLGDTEQWKAKKASETKKL